MTIAEPADATEILRLWPDGPPTVIDGVPPEAEHLVPAGLAEGTTFLRNVSDPTLLVFTPPEGTSNGVGIVVVPGGGWTILAWEHEGLDVCRWLTSHGYTAFLLKYRVQASAEDPATFEANMAAVDGIHANPWPKASKPGAISDLLGSAGAVASGYAAARAACADDGRRAIELARQEAERFGVRPEAIGAIGFSAGAFLLVDVALDPRAEQLAFIAPIYGGETNGAPVPADAPPLFTAVAQDDVLVNIVEGVHAEWTAAERPAELHGFARGQHGFGMVRQGTPSDRWTDLFLAWVEDLGLAKPSGA